MHKILKKVILLFIFFQKAFAGYSQSETAQQEMVKYSAKDLQEDYSILKKALETTYPSLYRFTDSAIITKYLQDQLASLNHPETAIEFYKTIALTCARVNDEHLIPSPPKEYNVSLKSSHHYFPFSLKVIDRRFYVLATASSNTTLPVGAEILSINGKTANEIQNILLATIPSDGYGETFNNRHLEDYSMTEENNLFDLNYPIFIQDTSSFTIEFIDRSDKSIKKITTLAGLDYKSYTSFYYGRNKLIAPLSFKYITSNVAYLRIASFLRWHRDRFKQDFYALYDSLFKDLNVKKTPFLVLDLRNNEGGDGTGEKLLTYLLNKPYRHFEATEEKFTGYPPVADYLERGKNLFFVDSLAYQTNAGMYRLKNEFHKYRPLLDEQQPNVNNYKGKLYVLINGASGSMASVVSSLLKGNGRAIFIGEEAGGVMEGTTSLTSVSLLLPHSKINIEIPLVKTMLAVPFTKGRGVEPDYNITPTADDVFNGIDTELNFTLGLISTVEIRKRY